jgi:hypothetical protein
MALFNPVASTTGVWPPGAKERTRPVGPPLTAPARTNRRPSGPGTIDPMVSWPTATPSTAARRPLNPEP